MAAETPLFRYKGGRFEAELSSVSASDDGSTSTLVLYNADKSSSYTIAWVSGGISVAGQSFPINYWGTFTSDSGSTSANSAGDTLTVAGAGIATTSISGDTLTITATEVDGSTTNELQNLWATITGDSGSSTANSLTDSFSIIGGDNISTEITADTLTINNTNPANVVGPGSSTDDAIARWDGTTGELLSDSAVTVSNSGLITTAGGVDLDGSIILRGTVDGDGSPVDFQDGWRFVGSAPNYGSLAIASLTASRSWTIPDLDGTFAMLTGSPQIDLALGSGDLSGTNGTFTGTFAANGNSTLGDAASDTLTINALTSFAQANASFPISIGSSNPATISGALANQLLVSQDLRVDDDLDVDDDAVIGGDLQVNGAGTVDGALTVLSSGSFADEIAGFGGLAIEGQPAAVLYNSSTQSLTSGAVTSVLLDSETSDTGGWHSTSVTTDRVTVDSDGLYFFQYMIAFQGNSTGDRAVWVAKNNETTSASHRRWAYNYSQHYALDSDAARFWGSGIIYLNASDFINIKAFQNAGVSLTIGSGNVSDRTSFDVYKIF